MPATTIALTGDASIDGLLTGERWAGNSVTYAFPTVRAQYTGYPHNYDDDFNPATPPITGVNDAAGFERLNAAQIAAAQAAFAELEQLTLLDATLLNTPRTAEIRIAETSTLRPGRTTAYAYFPGEGGQEQGDVWFNTTSFNNPILGTNAYRFFLHEIGHAVGLKHGYEAESGVAAVLPANVDAQEFALMTARSFIGGPVERTIADGHYPQSYMMLDIRALQTLYGADYGTNAGNTRYAFNPNNGEMVVSGVGQGVPRRSDGTTPNIVFRTIWDGNGVDTYDFSGYGALRQLDINLAPGGWIDVDRDSTYQAANLGADDGVQQFARAQVYNALVFNGDLRSLIENAIGGAGGDRIFGNQGRNTVEGRGGSDLLRGQGGNDVLAGGTGFDRAEGGAGNDTLYGGLGNDVIVGSAGSDVASYADVGVAVSVDLAILAAQNTGGGGRDQLVQVESLVGTTRADRLAGNGVANGIAGGGGNDVMIGRGGNDVLAGGFGADQMAGGAGNDRLEGGGGADVLAGGAGNDRFVYTLVSHAPANGARDTIQDFAAGDIIDLERIDATSAPGNQAFVFLGAGAFTGAAGQLRYVPGLVLGDVTGDGFADLAIRMTGAPVLTAASFDL